MDWQPWGSMRNSQKRKNRSGLNRSVQQQENKCNKKSRDKKQDLAIPKRSNEKQVKYELKRTRFHGEQTAKPKRLCKSVMKPGTCHDETPITRKLRLKVTPFKKLTPPPTPSESVKHVEPGMEVNAFQIPNPTPTLYERDVEPNMGVNALKTPPLQATDSDIEIVAELHHDRAPPVVDFGDEDITIVYCSMPNLDDSVVLLNNSMVTPPSRSAAGNVTSALVADSTEIPESVNRKGVKRPRSDEVSTDGEIGEESIFEKALDNFPSGTDSNSVDDSHQPVNKRCCWDKTSKQLRLTIQNDSMAKLFADNGSKTCSKENVNRASPSRHAVENMSDTHPNVSGVNLRDPRKATRKNVAETCSKGVENDATSAQTDILISDTDSNDIPESSSKNNPGPVLPNVRVMSETDSYAANEIVVDYISKYWRGVPVHQTHHRKRDQNKQNRWGPSTVIVPQLASLKEAQSSRATIVAGEFNYVQRVENTGGAGFGNVNEAQKHSVAVRKMLQDSLVHSRIPSNSHLRPVVIDGSNVARAHGNATGAFSCRGIAICIDHFLSLGHTRVTALVPQFRRNLLQAGETVTDQSMLDKLAKRQLVAFTPSRFLNGKKIVPYDDRFIVDLATRSGGVIVSNDNFRDIVGENDAWRHTVENRLLMYLFVGDIFMIPMDPFGRHGPRLKDVLSFSRT